jgi:hypothetical protein
METASQAGRREVRKRQGNGPKPSANEVKTAPQPNGKPKIPHRRILALGGGAVAVIILVSLFFFVSGSKETPQGGAPPKTAAPKDGSVSEPPAVSLPGLSGDDRKDFPVIRTIRFLPPQPTRMDTLKAEVLTEAPDPSRIIYAYVWKVNDRIVEGAEGDALNLSSLKKMDLITVIVTPYDGDRKGFPVESPVAVVYGIPPSLDLQVPPKTRKAGDPLELQLVSLHPDSAGVTFTLEAPIVPGMSIDNRTGKITWIIQPDQKGKIRFGAAVEDSDKTKVTKVFDVTLELS